MQMGKVIAVQDDSPAARPRSSPATTSTASATPATMRPPTTPLTRSAHAAGRPAPHGRRVARGEAPAPPRRRATPTAASRRKKSSCRCAKSTGSKSRSRRTIPCRFPALGLAYRVLNVVKRVEPGSPAEKAGLQADDVITTAEVIFAEGLEAGDGRSDRPVQQRRERRRRQLAAAHGVAASACPKARR